MSYECVALESTDLAQRIAQKCGKQLNIATYETFADGEVQVQLDDPSLYHDKTVVIIQSTGHHVNELTLGVAFLAQALKQAKAQKVIAVVPYLGYSRQEKGIEKGMPGPANLIAHLFESAGIDELIAVELHNESIVDFFSIPVTNVSIQNTLATLIADQYPTRNDICLVAPDKGAHDDVQSLAQQLGVGTITCSKERVGTDQTRVIDCDIACDGSIAIIVDDIISTGGTACHAGKLLIKKGYQQLTGYFVHPIFAGDALARMQAVGFQSIGVSNSLWLDQKIKDSPLVHVFDISDSIVSVIKPRIGCK